MCLFDYLHLLYILASTVAIVSGIQSIFINRRNSKYRQAEEARIIAEELRREAEPDTSGLVITAHKRTHKGWEVTYDVPKDEQIRRLLFECNKLKNENARLQRGLRFIENVHSLTIGVPAYWKGACIGLVIFDFIRLLFFN